MKKKFNVATLGCRTNQCESQLSILLERLDIKTGFYTKHTKNFLGVALKRDNLKSGEIIVANLQSNTEEYLLRSIL